MANYKRKRINKKKKTEPQSVWHKILFYCVLAFLLFVGVKACGLDGSRKTSTVTGCDAVIANYGSEIKKLSKEFKLSPNYLMALIMLESSGRKDIPPRFENSVYKRLIDVQQGKREHIENIYKKDIADASEEALRNLASSWGPFQLMGYKCLHLDIKIKDLRGESSLYYGVKWINETYGEYVRKGRYSDAFHIHNTGRAVPKDGKYQTYDPTYIPRGLEYMKYFEKHF